MATRKKYKIVLSEKYVRKSENGKEWFQFPVNISGQLVAIQTIIPLDPYTEPDMEQVRKEAYERGLSDAWEAARKICTNWVLPDSVLSEIFGMDKTIDDIMKESTASEAIEKIRQYEQEKEEQIQVGDEVIIRNKTAVVTEITDRYVRIMYSDGGCYALFSKGIVKTGRHFPEIAEVLQKMKKS